MLTMSTVASPFGALAVIVDPRAGEGSVAAELGAVERALKLGGLEHRVQVAAAPGEVARLATAALDEGYRYVAAVGDDATVQDVVNGMFRDGRTIVDSPVLAVVAAGSGCDLVRSFGLPGDVDGASSHLLGENTYELDVMKVSARGRNGQTDVRYAHNVAEVGLHASATATAARLPRWMGNGRRFVGFWAAINVAVFAGLTASAGLQVMKEFGAIAKINCVTMVITLAFNVIFISRYGIKGGLASSLLGEILLAAGLWLCLSRKGVPF